MISLGVPLESCSLWARGGNSGQALSTGTDFGVLKNGISGKTLNSCSLFPLNLHGSGMGREREEALEREGAAWKAGSQQSFPRGLQKFREEKLWKNPGISTAWALNTKPCSPPRPRGCLGWKLKGFRLEMAAFSPSLGIHE